MSGILTRNIYASCQQLNEINESKELVMTAVKTR